jgi:O-antigen ligase
VFLLVTIKGMATRRSLAVCGVVIGLFILANYADVESTMLGRLDRTFDASLSVEERTTGRFDLARGGWYLFLDNPFGVGTGAFSEAWSKLGHRGELSGFGEGVKKESHSGWIKILAENGVPGILLLLALVCSFAIEGWRRHNRNLILLGLFASTFLGISFLSTEFQSKGIWLLVATLLAVFSLVARRRSRSAPVPQMANPRRPTIRTVANAS